MEPRYSILDLPRGWAPCVAVGSSKSVKEDSPRWVMLSTDLTGLEEATSDSAQDGDEGYAYSIKIPGTPDWIQKFGKEEAEDVDAPFAHDAMFHLGINIRRNANPRAQRTLYVDIVPRRTVVNESGYTVQVCQELNTKILAQVFIGCILSRAHSS